MRNEAPEKFDATKLIDGSVHWHQGWEIFPGVQTPGRSLVATIFQAVGLPERLEGARVLDVGAWNGCASFECERRGAAAVVSLSLEDPEITGYNWLRQVLESERTSYVCGTIYDLDPAALGFFDIVICFGVIYHLRYPILGIDNLRRVATGKVFIETHVIDGRIEKCDEPAQSLSLAEMGLHKSALLQFYPGAELQNDSSNWCGPSSSAVVAIMESGGFAVEDVLVSMGSRAYLRARVLPGLPTFVEADGSSPSRSYESIYYDRNLGPLFGSIGQWRREDAGDGTALTGTPSGSRRWKALRQEKRIAALSSRVATLRRALRRTRKSGSR